MSRILFIILNANNKAGSENVIVFLSMKGLTQTKHKLWGFNTFVSARKKTH